MDKYLYLIINQSDSGCPGSVLLLEYFRNPKLGSNFTLTEDGNIYV